MREHCGYCNSTDIEQIAQETHVESNTTHGKSSFVGRVINMIYCYACERTSTIEYDSLDGDEENE